MQHCSTAKEVLSLGRATQAPAGASPAVRLSSFQAVAAAQSSNLRGRPASESEHAHHMVGTQRVAQRQVGGSQPAAVDRGANVEAALAQAEPSSLFRWQQRSVCEAFVAGLTATGTLPVPSLVRRCCSMLPAAARRGRHSMT